MADNIDVDNQALTPIHYWLAVKAIPRLASHKKIALVEKYGLTALFTHSAELTAIGLSQSQRMALTSPNWSAIDKIITASALCQSQIITYDDPNYPSLLKEIYDPPLVLFTRGNLDLLTLPKMAIVGSRNASVAGREIAHQFAGQLSRQFVITSGLALGIDAQAHLGTLHCQGATIAVVATGLDITYPSRHKSLQKDIIAKGGLIISEFAPGISPKAGHFPKRNRLISGLSLGVLVVEASLKSGSLITARCALEQGREVFSVPSSIFNDQAKGCHWLIKQGAKLVEDVADIREEFEDLVIINQKPNHNQELDNSSENSKNQHLCNDPMLASVGYEITPVDLVVSRSQLPIDVVLTRLTVLELKGLVSSVPGGYLKLDRG
ncbi:DNA protecting protein DprA [Colwellia chukchiensis]|uniref:DNA protecting protein DprA n=1 Tax=Colwellia chukchiensis TaxID=641665 RepID=A0A1H7PJ24_9GAMM|nr:DNA-processing protein DprA [Colwellia chukchiensis]SEL35762.1 DNA protecting protein DprA [Colwellia chukchiensis]